jgi:hypothetical protein
MFAKSVFPLIAFLTMTTPAWARQACTLSEVEQLVAQEKEALAALKRHQTELLKIPHVTGLGIGTLQNDEQGIIVLVDQCGPPTDVGKWRSTAVPGEPCLNLSHELEWEVPDRLDGVPVEIREYIGPKMPIGIAIGEPSPEGWVLPGDLGYDPNAKYCMPVVPFTPPPPEIQARIDQAGKVANNNVSRFGHWQAEGIPVTVMGPRLLNGQVVIIVGVNAEVTPEIVNKLPKEMGGFAVVVERIGPAVPLIGIGRVGS